jgi:antitoxin HicB
MATVETQFERLGSTITLDDSPEWHFFTDSTYQCRVLLCPDENGGFTAHALRLPGVVSEGDSLEEAIANITDAFRESIRVYRDCKADIPWEDIDYDRPQGSVERWILVNV